MSLISEISIGFFPKKLTENYLASLSLFTHLKKHPSLPTHRDLGRAGAWKLKSYWLYGKSIKT